MGTHTSRGGNPPFFFTELCPFFDLEFSKCSYSRALAPACGALVDKNPVCKHYMASDLGLHCLPMTLLWASRWTGLRSKDEF